MAVSNHETSLLIRLFRQELEQLLVGLIADKDSSGGLSTESHADNMMQLLYRVSRQDAMGPVEARVTSVGCPCVPKEN